MYTHTKEERQWYKERQKGKLYAKKGHEQLLVFKQEELQRCDNEQCLAALETRPYLKARQVGKVGKVRNL